MLSEMLPVIGRCHDDQWTLRRRLSRDRCDLPELGVRRRDIAQIQPVQHLHILAGGQAGRRSDRRRLQGIRRPGIADRNIRAEKSVLLPVLIG